MPLEADREGSAGSGRQGAPSSGRAGPSPDPAGPRRRSAMRALLPLLSVGRGWRVGAAARPPRRVMSLYRTEELGHPRSQDYRLFFSKSLAQLRGGAAAPCSARPGPQPAPKPRGRRGRVSARRAARGQPPSAATAAGPRRRAALLPLTSAPWPAARPRRPPGRC